MSVHDDLKDLFGPLKPELEADIAHIQGRIDRTHDEPGIELQFHRIVRELRITSETERTEIPAKERYRDDLLAVERALAPAGFTTGSLASNVEALVSIIADITASRVIVGRMVNPAGWHVQLIENGISGPVQFIDGDMSMVEAVRWARTVADGKKRGALV